MHFVRRSLVKSNLREVITCMLRQLDLSNWVALIRHLAVKPNKESLRFSVLWSAWRSLTPRGDTQARRLQPEIQNKKISILIGMGKKVRCLHHPWPSFKSKSKNKERADGPDASQRLCMSPRVWSLIEKVLCATTQKGPTHTLSPCCSAIEISFN
jgi:hypothetical protein